LRRRIAARARRLAEEQYDWEIVSGKLERLIEEAVERKAGSRPSQMIAIA
jgi:glycosyltransferase involved in cell wall biosynthesis